MTVVKFAVYWSLVAASYQVGLILGVDYIVEVAVAYLAVNEFVSILENARSVMGEDVFPEAFLDLIKANRRGGKKK